MSRELEIKRLGGCHEEKGNSDHHNGSSGDGVCDLFGFAGYVGG